MPLKLENCPVLFQSLIGHSGSTVLQSLFDGHPEVAMFPGVLSFYTHLHSTEALQKHWRNSLQQILHHQFRYSSSATWLGDSGKESVADITDEILERTHQILSGRPFSRRALFFAIHQAIAELTGQDLARIKIIWCHEHDVNGLLHAGLPAALADGLNCRVLINVRDPRSNWLSVERITSKEIEYQPVGSPHYDSVNNLYAKCVQQFLLSLRYIDEYKTARIDLIRLEDIQRARFDSGKKLAAQLGLSYHPCLERTTFWGKKWTGHWLSNSPSGIASSALPENWISSFRGLRAASVERVLAPEIEALGYPFPLVSPWLPRRLFLPWVLRQSSLITTHRLRSGRGVRAKASAYIAEGIRVLRHVFRMCRHAVTPRHYNRISSLIVDLGVTGFSRQQQSEQLADSASIVIGSRR